MRFILKIQTLLANIENNVPKALGAARLWGKTQA